VERLDDKVLDSGEREIAFIEESRRDFVGKALTLRLDASLRVKWVEFYDLRGLARWHPGRPVGYRRWEDENDLPRRGRPFPALMLDGTAPERPEMLNAVLSAIAAVDERVAAFVRAAMADPSDATLVVPGELLG